MTSRKMQAAKRREQLLHLGKKLFAEKGYHATSTREINHGVGAGDGILYHYFPGGKLELLQTIVSEGLNKKNQKMEQELSFFNNDNLSLKQVLIKFMRILYKVMASDPQLDAIMLREKRLLDSDVSKGFSYSVKEGIQFIISILKSRAEKGEIQELDYELAAVQLLSVNTIFLQDERYDLDIFGQDLDAYRERMIDFIIQPWIY